MNVAPYESRFVDKNGDIRWAETSLSLIKKDNMPSYILIINSDITERKQAENKIIKSLQEKDILLREIHHRVKNNMQIISSLLNLQIQQEGLNETIDVLIETQGRIKSMALIHEKLYQSDSFININFKEYIEKLVMDIFYSYGIKAGSIEPVFDFEEINLNIDTAIPLGLISNELVTNSIKYAFPESEGTINIKFKSLQDEMELIIKDDGIGISENLDIENTKTLGLQLVNILTEQIDGEIKLDRTNGTKYKITFKELKYKERI
jgi:two-component sensor histidine kinase